MIHASHKFIKYVFYALLCLVFFVQCLYLGLWWSDHTFIVPKLIRLSPVFKKAGLILDSTRFNIAKDGSLFLEKGTLRFIDQPDAFIRFDTLSIQLNWLPILLGKFTPKYLHSTNIELHHPFFDTVPLVRIPELNLSYNKHCFKLSHTICHINQLQTLISGNFYSRNNLSTDSFQPDKYALYIAKLSDFLNHFENPLAYIYLEAKNAHTLVHIICNTPKASYAEYQIEKLNLKGLIHLDKKNTQTAQINIQAHTCKNLNSSLNNLELKVELPDISNPTEFSFIEFCANTIRYKDYILDSIQGSFPLIEWPYLEGKIQLTYAQQYAHIKSFLDLYGQKSFLKFKTCLYPTQLSSILESFPILANSHFTSPFLLNGHCVIENKNIQRLQCHAYTQNFKFQSILVDFFSTHIQYTPSSLILDATHIRTPSSNVQGSYSHNLDTSDYRFLLEGHLDPSLITPLMEDWWSELWPDFKFHKSFPSASVDVKGNWQKKCTHFVYGYASIQDCTFRSVPIDQASLYFWAQPSYLQLFNLNIQKNQTSAIAQIDWLYQPTHPNSFYAILYKAKSNLDLTDLSHILKSQSVAQIAQSFQCTHTPQLEGHGVLFNDPLLAQKEDTLDIVASLNHSLSYEGIALSHLYFHALKKGTHTHIDALSFGLAQGLGEGILSIQSQSPRDYLSFDLTLKNADYSEIQTLSQYIKRFRHSEEHTTPPPPSHSSIGGQVTIHTKGNGHMGDFQSFQAEGDFKLKNAELGQVNFFGQLSKAINIGSFDLKNIHADFYLDKNLLTLSDVSIKGRTAQMQGKGTYHLQNNHLNFHLQFFILGGWRIPIISHILRWVDPVSKIFLINLSGTLEEPEWKVNISPFGLFSKKPTPQPSI